MHDDDFEDGRVIVVKKGAGLSSFLIGLAVGAGIALLYAPQSGAETRRIIRRKARRAAEHATELAEDVADDMRGRVAHAKERLHEGVDAARDGIDRERRHVKDTVRAGRDAARTARSELETRLAEAKERARAETMRPRHGSATGPGDTDAGA